MQTTNDTLILQLIDVLQQPDLNYSQVLDLAGQLARLDTDNVRFFTDASLINRLGRELVVKQETAVSELVKNAHDADATNVMLTFIDTNQPGGTIIIEDNGHGMDRDQIINGFMRISTTDKTHNPVSEKYGRKRAGRKGIGRFAAQRLGKKLTIISQTVEKEPAWQVEIDWELYEGDQEIFQIPNQISEVKKEGGNGTKLIIDNLEEAWTSSQIQRVFRYLVDLIQPFPLSKSTKSSIEDPGFDIRIERSTNGEKEIIASVEKLVYDFALAEIDGTIDKNGKAKWSINSRQLEIKESSTIGKDKDNTTTRFDYIRNIKLKAYYYIYRDEFVPRSVRTSLRNLSLERGGLRLYRNGFRVLPYGEQGDDWLGLDLASSRREFLPPGNNTNFFGFVEIIDEEGKLFEETASREGLIENEAVSELKDFVFRVLVTAVLRVAEARERKQRPVKRDIPERSPGEQIKDAANNIREAANKLKLEVEANIEKEEQGSAENGLSYDVVAEAEKLRDTANFLERIVIEQDKEKARLLEEIGMLRVLASLGLAIEEFSHEVKHLIPSTLADVNQLLNIHSDTRTEKIVKRLLSNLNHFGTYTAVFDRAASDNVRREVLPQELGVVLRSFHTIIKPSCDRYGIEFPEPEIKGYDLFTTPMHPSEWISMLYNLFTNSVKAIRRANVKKGKIMLVAGSDNGKVFVDFSDNGEGVAPEYEERIFEAFFSTSTQASPFSDDEDSLTGTGLGLKIIRDIVISYNGEITLIGAPRGYKTCFRIELPKATDEELSNGS